MKLLTTLLVSASTWASLATANSAGPSNLPHQGFNVARYWTIPHETPAISNNKQLDSLPNAPKPTEPPRRSSGPATAFDLLRRNNANYNRKRQGSSSNPWLDESTCGWWPGYSSEPYTCGAGVCATDLVYEVVNCMTDESPIPTACLDSSAYEQGLCDNAGLRTRCCYMSDFPVCGTLYWETDIVTTLSIIDCFDEDTIAVQSLNDKPQYIIDEMSTSAGIKTVSNTQTVSGQDINDLSSSGSGTSSDKSDNSSKNSNLAAIIGGVVGGISGLSMIGGAVVAFLLYRKRAQNRKAAAAAAADLGGSGPGPAPMGMSTEGPYDTTFDQQQMPDVAPCPPPLANAYVQVPIGTSPQASYDPGKADLTSVPIHPNYHPPSQYMDPQPPLSMMPHRHSYYSLAPTMPPSARESTVHELDPSQRPPGHAGNPVELH